MTGKKGADLSFRTVAYKPRGLLGADHRDIVDRRDKVAFAQVTLTARHMTHDMSVDTTRGG